MNRRRWTIAFAALANGSFEPAGRRTLSKREISCYQGEEPIAFQAEVAAAAPWCGAAGTNVEIALPSSAANGFTVWARDYPTREFNEVFCFRCDDGVDPIRHIDSPQHLEETSGPIQVAGWATDSSGIAEVAFRLDGVAVTLGSFLYGVSRPDVCDFHSELNDPNCPDVGYQGSLDTTAFSRSPAPPWFQGRPPTRPG